jgi:hypothetical protein
LRTGRPPDDRVDALTRDLAEFTLRNSWRVWYEALMVLLMAIATVLQLSLGSRPIGAVGYGLFMIGFAGLLGGELVSRRRSRRYLAGAGRLGNADGETMAAANPNNR